MGDGGFLIHLWNDKHDLGLNVWVDVWLNVGNDFKRRLVDESVA
jgi:hypothetical protein